MSVDIELRKAAALINAGKLESARTILSDYLKDFPESDLAWLLMSYVLEDPRKQQASATRAFRLNPANEQAKMRIDQLLQFQAPERPEVTSEDFSHDFERFNPDRGPLLYPDQDPVVSSAEEPVAPSDSEELTFPDEQPSPPSTTGRSSAPLSIEERLAFVTLEADSPHGETSSRYPEDSLLSNIPSSKTAASGGEGTRRLSLITIAGMAVIITLLVAVGYFAVKYFTGGFISEEEAQATAAMGTQIAWATNEVKGRLPATWTPTVTATVMPSSTPKPSPMPSATASSIPPDPTLRAEIETLQEQVAELRQLSILQEVETFLIGRTKVRSILEDYYFSFEGSEDEIIDQGRVLVALGLIEPTYDLVTNVLNTLVDGIGGFYLHETNRIYILGNQFSGIEKFIYSHEFGHALVDQHFDLHGLAVYPVCEGNEDRCKAIQALIEGDATRLMLQWLDQGATVSEYNAILSYRPPTRVLPEQSPPPFALRNGEFTYTEGQAFIDRLFENGEWTAVNQAYSRLPESTEQILHPEKYISGEQPLQVPEVSLDEVLPDGWERIQSNTLGEWLTYLILGYGTNPNAQLNEGDAARASEGWGGDHYQVYINEESDGVILVVHWKWDRPSDSNEFATEMRYYLKGRFSVGEVVEVGRECWNGIDQFTCLYSGYQQSLWIIAPSLELIDAIDELYPDF